MTVGTALVVCSAEEGGRKGWKHWAWGRHFGNLGKSLFVYIQMYDKITHTNVWQKHAYKYMTKTRIKMYEKNMRVEMFLGRSQDCGHCIGSLFSWGRRKKRKKTLGMRKAFWKFGQIFICIHTNVWQDHAYKCMTKNTHTNTHTKVWQKPAYKCMKKNRHTNVWKKQA